MNKTWIDDHFKCEPVRPVIACKRSPVARVALIVSIVAATGCAALYFLTPAPTEISTQPVERLVPVAHQPVATLPPAPERLPDAPTVAQPIQTAPIAGPSRLDVNNARIQLANSDLSIKRYAKECAADQAEIDKDSAILDKIAREKIIERYLAAAQASSPNAAVGTEQWNAYRNLLIDIQNTKARMDQAEKSQATSSLLMGKATASHNNALAVINAASLAASPDPIAATSK